MRSDKLLRKEQKRMKSHNMPKTLDQQTEKQLEILQAIQAIDFPKLMEEEKSNMIEESNSQELVF